MTVPEKLSRLREGMRRRGIAAYIIVTDDFHGSEYVGEHFKAREYMTGFTGSAGTLVVLPDWAGMWTDGRYFLQAGRELRGSSIELMKSGEKDVPDVPDFLREKLENGSTVGFDGRTVSGEFAGKLSEKLKEKNVRFLWDQDLVDEIWEDRPPLSAKPLWELDASFTGQTREEKLRRVREAITRECVDVLVLTALDEIAWLLNLRGDDVACAPVFLSYMLIEREKATLYMQECALSGELREKLECAGVTVASYQDFYEQLRGIPEKRTVWVDGSTSNYCVIKSLNEKVHVIDKPSPVIQMKAVKTAEEQENIRRAHIKDGVAVTKFIYWLKTHVGKERVTELCAAERLLSFRREQENFVGPSFESIIAYGPHGAVVHYSPSTETDIELEPKGLCLADTGGHYLEGSTDITRTVVLGPITQEERHAFTVVLRGHLALAGAKFKKGCCGANLDILAREPLWEEGLDYNHGTGHGVGYLLNVHEGPQRVHWRITNVKQHAELEEGMVFSDEPGLYVTEKFGIRHENLVLVRRGKETQFGQFMELEPLTMVPFDKDGIDISLMRREDIEQLNRYHATVYEKISPYFEGDEHEWLRAATAPIEM